MQLLAQIPGAEQAIRAAATESWVAVLLVVLVLAGFGCFGYVIRQILNDGREREKVLNTRIAELEGLIRGELLLSLKGNAEMTGRMLNAADSICRAADRMTQTLERFSAIMEVQPCLALTAHQRLSMADVAEGK